MIIGVLEASGKPACGSQSHQSMYAARPPWVGWTEQFTAPARPGKAKPFGMRNRKTNHRLAILLLHSPLTTQGGCPRGRRPRTAVDRPGPDQTPATVAPACSPLRTDRAAGPGSGLGTGIGGVSAPRSGTGSVEATAPVGGAAGPGSTGIGSGMAGESPWLAPGVASATAATFPQTPPPPASPRATRAAPARRGEWRGVSGECRVKARRAAAGRSSSARHSPLVTRHSGADFESASGSAVTS